MEPTKREFSDLLELYHAYEKLGTGPKAELRRVSCMEDLLEVPAFYRLTRGYGTQKSIQRLVFCLPYVTHKADGNSLGQALANGKVSEKRLFMVIRSQEPNDLIQLRRLLQQVKPVVNMQQAAKQIFFWNERAKRQLLEDFFFYQKESA